MSIQPKTFWFTGLPCAGKTTLSTALSDLLKSKGNPSVLIDGDDLRSGLCSDLGFSFSDRHENIRRAAEMAALLNRQGFYVCCSFVSPSAELRMLARTIIRNDCFVEIFVDTPVETCETRDVKGMYQRARAGELKNFTGISAVYENPEHPEIRLKAGEWNVEECLLKIISYLGI